MKKKSEEEGGKVNFDDGVYITIPGDMPKPRHFQFYCKTSMSGSAEACDVRLAKIKLPASSSTTWRDSQVDATVDDGSSSSTTDRRNLFGHGELVRFPYRSLLDDD